MRGKKIFLSFCILLLGLSLSAQNAPATIDSSNYLLTRLSLNSNRSDYGPFLLGKSLYFSSGRVHRYGLVYVNEDTTQELEDVFYAEKIDSVNFKHVHYFSEKVNTRFNDGPMCFNKPGDLLYITGNDIKRINKHIEPLDIFVSHKVNGHWAVPTSLPFCTGANTYCHPALMNDGKTLIFASDLPGGIGGMDLYCAIFENGKWSQPKNMGAKINGPKNEIFPFVNANNVLYFSSNRDGNLDIFSFDLKDAFDSEIKKEEWPLNSEKDDFGVWIDSSGAKGYFSSDRGGNDDIYYFENRYPRFENCVPQKKPTYCYTFFEESTIQSDDTLGMVYEWDLGDGAKKRGIEVKHCYANPGNYSVQLNVVDKASGALFMNELSYDFTVEEAKLLYIVSGDTLVFGQNASFESNRSAIPGHTIGDRYWFFGDGKMGQGKDVSHRYEKQGIYQVQLGVMARNDSTGKIETFCTQKTVLVKDSLWIRNHKIALTKVVWPPPDHVKPKFHAKEGKDVDFRVHLGSSKEDIPVDAKMFSDLGDVRKTKEKDKYHYTSGKVKKAGEAVPYYHKARERGFKDAAVLSFYKDSIIANQEGSMKGEIAVVWSGGVYFDFNQAKLADQYRSTLDSVSDRLKKDKKLDLIILAESDSVGTSAYNLKLSKRRAAAVQKYLAGRGVSEKRLDVINWGENLPSEYNSKKNVLLSNRRVELIIVKNPK